jgi:hypothetical protein
MRYEELRCDGKIFTSEAEIARILKSKKFYWLIDSEIENAIIEIKNDTIVWHDGNYYSGTWPYGIFKHGSFHGIWECGIFESGNFDGTWIDGIRL